MTGPDLTAIAQFNNGVRRVRRAYDAHPHANQLTPKKKKTCPPHRPTRFCVVCGRKHRARTRDTCQECST